MKAKLREHRHEAVGPNEVRAMDFVHDQLALGSKLRILAVVDIHSRYCPAIDPRFAYRGEDVVQTPERVCCQIGYPRTIRVDNDREFIETLICGPMPTTSLWTSRAPAGRLTTGSSRRSTASSGQNA